MKKNKMIINFIVYSILWLIVIIFKMQYDCENNFVTLKFVTILGIIINIFCILSSYSVKKRFTDPYIMFQTFSLFFLYGQLFCREIINLKIDEIFDLSILVTMDSMIQACFLIMFCQLGLHLGYFIYYFKNKKEKNENKQKNNFDLELKVLKKLGFLLLFLSIIPACYSFYADLSTSAVKGYAGLSDNNVYGITSIFSKIIPFFQISLMLLMVGYKESNTISKVILFFSIAFYGCQMFFGNRGIPLIAIITFAWLYHVVVKKINKKIIALICILIIPISSILNIIRMERSYNGIRDWIYNLDDLMINNISNNNPVFETLYEIGTTIYPISYTIDAIPNKIPYKYGKLYFLSILSVVAVNTSNEKNSLAYDMNIAAQMSDLSGSPFGGSFIQEAYSNFGWFCPGFMILLGYILELLDNKIKQEKNLIILVLIGYFLNPLIWVIRNVLITLPREIIWYILPTYILYKFIYNKTNKMENIND